MDDGSILVVMSASGERQQLFSFLDDDGHRVQHVDSGDGALRTVANNRPDLILLDTLWPGMDAFETCRQLKANEASAEIPVIFIGTKDTLRDTEACFAAGAADFLIFPCDKPELLARLRPYLELAQALRDLKEMRASLRASGEETSGHEVNDLRDSEQRATSFFANMPGFAFSFQMPDKGPPRFPFTSPGIEQIYGLRPDEVRDDMSSMHALAHPDDRPRIETALREANRTLEPFHLEFRIQRSGGPERWLECRSLPERQPDGETVWHGIMLDISERKATEQHMELLGLAIDSSHDAVFLIDNKGHIRYVNATACSDLGYSREELLGMTPLDFNPDTTAEILQALMEKTLAGTHQIIEVRHRAKNGRIFPVEISASVVNFGGESLSLVIARDITERKHMQEALGKSESDFRSLAENSPDNIIRYDLEHRILYLNTHLLRELPFDSVDQAIGKRPNELAPDGSYAEIEEMIDQLIAGDMETATVHQPVIGKNGETCFHDIKLVPEFDASGKMVSVLGIGRDMTDIYRMKEALAKSERDFRSLTENLPDNIVRWDTQGNILYSNPTHQRTMHVSTDETIGSTHCCQFPDEHIDKFNETMAQIVTSGKGTTLTRVPVPGDHGESLLHDIKLVPEFDTDGKVISILGLGRDMTETYRMQEALLTREQEFRSLAENSPDYIIRYDLDHRILYLNGHLMRDLQLGSVDDVLGRRPIEVWPDGRFSALDAAAQRVIASGMPETIEMLWERPPGVTEIGQIVVVPECNVEGAIIGTLAFGRNITSIREAEGRLKHLTDNLPGYVYSFNLTHEGELNIPYISATCEAIYGLRPDEVKDAPNTILTRLHPDDLPRIKAALDESAQNLTPFRVEYRVQRPGHAECWLEVRAQPEHLVDGTIVWHGMALDITERKHSQDALAIREQEFRSLAESSPDSIIRYDLDHRILYLNERLVRDLELGSAVDVISRRPIEVWPDGRFSAIDEAARRVIASGVEETIEMHWERERNPGVTVTGLVVVVPDRNVDGTIIGTLAFGRDITELKRTGEMLAQAQAIARLGSWDWNIIADRVEWSEMAFEIYAPDARPAAPGFEDFKRSVHPDDLERVVAAVTAAFELNTPFELEHRVVSRSKGMRTVHAQGMVFRASDGTPVRMVGTVQDITERKEAQQRMELLERAVAQSSEAVWLVAPDLRIHYVNDTACQMLGYNQEEMLQLTPLDIDPDASREAALGMMDKKLMGELILFESRHTAKDGRSIPVEISATLIEYQGDYFNLLGIRDITERKRVEATMRERLEEVSRLQRLQTADELATTLAHELNQPLAAIAMYTEAVLRLLEDQNTPPDMRRIGETLLRVKKQALRAGESIRQLRAFVGRSKLEPQSINLNVVLREACDLILPQMKAKDIRLELKLDASQPQVVGVEVHVEQVLLNLLRNAIEAIAEAGISNGRITVTSRISRSFAQVSVCDTGPGISDELAETLFGSLESHKPDGLGVGLRISRGLIEAQEGGRLWVQPQTPSGVFHFVLPLA